MSISKAAQQNIMNLLRRCEFRKLCDTYFSDEFLWIIKGSSLLSGTYSDKENFFETVIDPLSKLMLPNWKMHIVEKYVDGDTLIIEMRGEAKTKNGGNYNNEYCWIFKFENGKVTSLTAYYDSLLVNKTLKANHVY